MNNKLADKIESIEVRLENLYSSLGNAKKHGNEELVLNRIEELETELKELKSVSNEEENEMESAGTITATLINYFDVWGNAEDGYEINNLCKEGELTLNENFTDAELLQELQDIGFIVEEATMKDITFEWAGSEMIEIYETEKWYPLGRVELPY